jgi:predicted DNA-binding transcriptional regulator YafY
MSQPTVRILALLEMLQARGLASGALLAQAINVDRRTLRRYIATLEEMGIPITSTPGRLGGYQVVPGFRLPPMMFTDDEALALAVALLAARGLGLAQTLPAVGSARAKLERVLPLKLRKRLSAVDETVAIELVRPVAPLDHVVLALLSAATQECRQVRLTYSAAQSEETRRHFNPYGLVYRGGRWYSVGWCHLRKGLRSFRLDRIRAASATDVRFERPANFDSLAYLKGSIARLPRAHSIEVLLATDLATAQRELFSAFGVLESVEAGVLLRSQADDLDWFSRQLSRLPFDFTVRSPAALRSAVALAGRRMLRLAKRQPFGVTARKTTSRTTRGPVLL